MNKQWSYAECLEDGVAVGFALGVSVMTVILIATVERSVLDPAYPWLMLPTFLPIIYWWVKLGKLILGWLCKKVEEVAGVQ